MNERMRKWNEKMAQKQAADRAEREAEEAFTAKVKALGATEPEPVATVERVRAATDPQIRYLKRLGVELEVGMTIRRASELIDGAKNEYLESIGGHYTGTTDAGMLY